MLCKIYILPCCAKSLFSIAYNTSTRIGTCIVPRIRKSSDADLGLKIDDYVRITGNSDVDGSCSVGGSLNVVGNSLYNGILSVRTAAQVGANLQILTSDD